MIPYKKSHKIITYRYENKQYYIDCTLVKYETHHKILVTKHKCTWKLVIYHRSNYKSNVGLDKPVKTYYYIHNIVTRLQTGQYLIKFFTQLEGKVALTSASQCRAIYARRWRKVVTWRKTKVHNFLKTSQSSQTTTHYENGLGNFWISLQKLYEELLSQDFPPVCI